MTFNANSVANATRINAGGEYMAKEEKQIIQTRSRWNDILFEGEYETIKDAVIAAKEVGMDLRDADLRGAHLIGVDLRGMDLRGADLSGANLCDADLRGADLRNAILSNADLQCVKLQNANLQDAILRGAELCGAKLQGSDLYGADLSDADLQSANLSGADLSGANLRDADLRNADFHGAEMFDTVLQGADLRGAHSICLFYGVGESRRYGFAVSGKNKTANVQLGCFWGPEEAAIEAIRAKYGPNSAYEMIVQAACAVVRAQVEAE